jgi:transcriptional regulator
MRGDSHWTRTTPEKVTRGTRVNTAKLTEEKVREIRLRVAAGQKQTSVAREFGVRNTNVSAIVRRETWKHVA